MTRLFAVGAAIVVALASLVTGPVVALDVHALNAANVTASAMASIASEAPLVVPVHAYDRAVRAYDHSAKPGRDVAAGPARSGTPDSSFGEPWAAATASTAELVAPRGPMSGSALANAGHSAEDAGSAGIGIPRNAGPGRVTVSGSGPGGFRVPDYNPFGRTGTIATRGTVVQVKDVGCLSFSSQLRDLVGFAQEQGVPLEIFTNARLSQSGQLARWIERGQVIIQPLP